MCKRGKVIYGHMHKRNIHVQKGKVPSPYGEGWMQMNVPFFNKIQPHIHVCKKKKE